ncbi:MAG: hypothetical protein LBD35_00845 [Prevotellaceae bacterium]|nr:hypothetical protein [Prevotellaceae bacterium]
MRRDSNIRCFAPRRRQKVYSFEPYGHASLWSFRLMDAKSYGLSGFQSYGLSGLRAFRRLRLKAYGLSGLRAHGLTGFQSHGHRLLSSLSSGGFQASGLQGMRPFNFHSVRAFRLTAFQAHGIWGLSAYSRKGHKVQCFHLLDKTPHSHPHKYINLKKSKEEATRNCEMQFANCELRKVRRA